MLTSIAVVIIGVLMIASPVTHNIEVVFGVVVALLALVDLLRGHVRIP